MSSASSASRCTCAQYSSGTSAPNHHENARLNDLDAVARGAKIIEKHFTLDRSLPGPDHKASLEPAELTQMVRDIRALQAALGDGGKTPQPSEWDTRQAARQQVVASRDIAAARQRRPEVGSPRGLICF